MTEEYGRIWGRLIFSVVVRYLYLFVKVWRPLEISYLHIIMPINVVVGWVFFRKPYCWNVMRVASWSVLKGTNSHQISWPPVPYHFSVLPLYSLNLRCNSCFVHVVVGHPIVSCSLYFYQLCFSLMVSICYKEKFLCWGVWSILIWLSSWNIVRNYDSPVKKW